MNGVQTRFKCKLDVKRCKRFVFPPSSLLPRSNALKTKAIRYFQTDRTLTRIVSPPLRDFTIQYLIQATFYEVCQLLLKHLEIKKKKLPHKEDIFKQFLKLVETHHYKERDISFYAEKLCLTPKYLSSIIRDVSGELAGNWIDNYVIIEAKALLISSNLTIQEICYKLNFSTPSSFTRFFKRITGMSPRKFRTLKVFPNLIE